MKAKGHRITTGKVMDLLDQLRKETGAWEFTLGEKGYKEFKDSIVEKSVETDELKDLELVDVDCGRDNPHKNDLFENSDSARYVGDYDYIIYEKKTGLNFTAFNHFIDIKKGPGKYDDYDGYSYNKGSGHKEQYESTSGTWYEELFTDKVDYDVNWGLNDEYVHIPGRSWYKNCSPSVERYSFYNDKGVFLSKIEELRSRFPLAEDTGTSEKGIPYSVFMPVDNLAQFWYSRYVLSKDYGCLGHVLHAIQDAAIPHHAAGYLGNWHQKYEKEFNDTVEKYSEDSLFIREVIDTYKSWEKSDSICPSSLRLENKSLIPSKNWEIDQLVTWIALNSYNEYDKTYNHFKKGYRHDEDSQRYLAAMAFSMSMLILKKASEVDFIISPNKKVKRIDVKHKTSAVKHARTNGNFGLELYYEECGGNIEIPFPELPYNEREYNTLDAYSFDVSQYSLDYEKLKISICNYNTDAWLPSSVTINCMTEDGRIHTYADISSWPENLWFESSEVNKHEIPKQRYIPENKRIKQLTVIHTTSNKRHACTDGEFSLILRDSFSTAKFEFMNQPHNEREQGIEDQYTFNTELCQFSIDDVRIAIRNNSRDGWLPLSIKVIAETFDCKVVEIVDIANWPSDMWFDKDNSCTPLHWLN